MSIRRFFIDRNAADFINTSMLLRHAACFIIYIVTTFSFFLAFGYYTFKPTIQVYEVAAVVGICFSLGSAVSQVLLCMIFWDLGKKIEKADFDPTESRQQSPSVLDVIVSADFDEDAELQANIWNSLVRRVEEISEE